MSPYKLVFMLFLFIFANEVTALTRACRNAHLARVRSGVAHYPYFNDCD